MNSKCDYSIHRIEPPWRRTRRKRRRMRSDWGLWTELWVIPCRHVLISKEIHSQDAIGTREKRRRGNLWWACEDDWITVYGHSKESNHRRLIKAGNLMGGGAAIVTLDPCIIQRKWAPTGAALDGRNGTLNGCSEAWPNTESYPSGAELLFQSIHR